MVFLVDRKDLDNQTLAEFNKFQEDSVDFTDNTRKLLRQLADPTLPLIVTTIQNGECSEVQSLSNGII